MDSPYEVREYAEEVGVSAEEAIHRFELSEAAGMLSAELETAEAITFGGLYLVHQPEFHVVVQFTEAAEETLAR